MDTINKSHLVETADGSKTIFHQISGEHYHSRHGAVGESRHVFVGMGLEYIRTQMGAEVRVLEVGFGTGLNFLLSAAYALEQGFKLDYTGVEAYPLTVEVMRELDYDQYLPVGLWSAFLDEYPQALQVADTDAISLFSPEIRLRMVEHKILDARFGQSFDLIYFDAFSATHQPEMWTPQVLAHVTQYLRSGGVFVTYSITGSLKRSLRELGFTIQKLPGAPGKREMLRALKN